MYAVLNLRPFDPAHVNAMPRRVRYVGTVVIAPRQCRQGLLTGLFADEQSSAPWARAVVPEDSAVVAVAEPGL